MRNKWLFLFLLSSAEVFAQPGTQAAIYYSPSLNIWQPYTGVAAFGAISTVPTLQVQAYCQASAGAQWAPCSFSSGGSMTWPTTPGYALWQSGTTWSTPHLTDSSGTVSSSEPFAIVQASNQLVTGTSTNTTTSTYPASSGAVTRRRWRRPRRTSRL